MRIGPDRRGLLAVVIPVGVLATAAVVQPGKGVLVIQCWPEFFGTAQREASAVFASGPGCRLCPSCGHCTTIHTSSQLRSQLGPTSSARPTTEHGSWDGVDPSLVDQAEHALTHVPGIDGIAQLRRRWFGHRLIADVHLDFNPDLSLAAAHGIAHDAERQLVGAVRELGSATDHAYPAHPTA